MKLKRILSVIISACIFFSLLIPVNAAAVTTAEKVDVLKKLTIFSSTTLEAQVKRHEAAVYAVRMLGKEQYVRDRAATYKNTQYSDVDSSQWYAPYVGYCDELGLIKDSTSGKFQPEKNITEKAFLNILLSAMDYIYKTDYTIPNIFAKAYELGLYTDAAYKTKTADNSNFKKSEIVNILYNALGKTKKGTKVKMIQNLVTEKVITKETAISTGLIIDSISTAVSQVTIMDQSNLMVKFNEPILSLTAENIKIYRTGSPDKTLTFSIKSQGSDGMVILGIGAQEAFESYTIEFINVKDAEGNEAELLTGSFEGVQSTEVQSDFFRISKAVPVSKDCINVYFTQPVNINSLIASSYEIWSGESVFLKGSSQTLALQPIPGTNNGVSVYLKNTAFTKDAVYVLKISGSLTGAYGVKLNDGNGDSFKFKGVETSGNTNTGTGTVASDLSVTNISLVDSQTMKLEFNMEITPTLAKQVMNYYIADAVNTQLVVKKAALTSEAGKNNRIVLVSVNGAFAAAATYTLSIDYLTDVTRQYIIDGKQYSFTASFPAKVNLYFTSISNVDGNTVKVVFNKALDKESAENVANYSITGVNHTGYTAIPAKAIYNPSVDPYSVMLYLPATNPLQKDKVYMVNAMATLKDSLGNVLSSKISNVLTCTNATVTKPSIKEAVMISSDAIRVDFNKEIVLDEPGIFTSNYTLQYIENGDAINKAPIGIIIISKTRFILKFDTLNQNTAYKLGFGELGDYSGNSNGIDVGGQGSITVAPPRQ